MPTPVLYVPLPVDEITLGEPMPVNVWDPHGRLLLRKGQPVQDEQQRQWLAMHNPLVRASEFRDWTYRYTTEIDRALRHNRSLQAIASVARPMGTEGPSEPDPDERPLPERWADLHASLTLLLHQGEQAQDFVGRFLQLEQRIQQAVRLRVDDSLLVLTQMLFDRSVGYSASHALLCALIVREVSQTLGWDEAVRSSLQRAALTMNLGMARLHDDLARQGAGLHPEQRQLVLEHPLRSEAMLRRLGVADALWLEIVRDHHEQPGGGGYPLGRPDPGEPAQLLSLADAFVARMGPRAARAGLPAPQAARELLLTASGTPSPLGSAFLKTFGVYFPGSYVELANGELAVVARRAGGARAPLVFAVRAPDGLPRGEPPLRDTSEPAFRIERGISADEVKLRLPLTRLLARL
jgi:hypothetical protein